MLELRNINKGFGEKQILSNFSLKILGYFVYLCYNRNNYF